MTALRDTREIIRDEPLMHRPILDSVAGGPRTIPEIARALDRPAHEVLYWVMGMRRYGLLVESPAPDDDGFFQYGRKDAS